MRRHHPAVLAIVHWNTGFWVGTQACFCYECFPMRIAVTIEELDPARGGAEGATVRLIRGLAERGHEVHVLTRRCAVELPATIHLVGGNSVFKAVREWRFPHWVAKQLVGYDLSVACGRGFAEDVIWSHNGAHGAAMEGQLHSYQCLGARLARLAQYYYSPKAWVYRRIEALRYKRQPVVIAVSKMCAEDFRRAGIKNVRVAYYQINLDRFTPTQKQPDGLTVLCVAQNFRRKGVRTLIEAAAGKFRVLIAGAGKPIPSPNVEFLGPVENIEKVYAQADVFCLPTFYDPCAIVIIEAMACGLPTITSRFNGASELIRHGEDGFVLQDPGNPKELAELLDRLKDVELRRKIGEAAVKTARAFVQNPANDIAGLIEQIARSRKTSAVS
jgi:UDP-glucose:(heptosyl)LPS alpha-1,3-glucosyltransferase